VTIIYEESSIDTNGDPGCVSNNERRLNNNNNNNKLLAIEASQRRDVNIAKSLTI
jgi:hypothetical protein